MVLLPPLLPVISFGSVTVPLVRPIPPLGSGIVPLVQPFRPLGSVIVPLYRFSRDWISSLLDWYTFACHLNSSLYRSAVFCGFRSNPHLIGTNSNLICTHVGFICPFFTRSGGHFNPSGQTIYRPETVLPSIGRNLALRNTQSGHRYTFQAVGTVNPLISTLLHASGTTDGCSRPLLEPSGFKIPRVINVFQRHSRHASCCLQR